MDKDKINNLLKAKVIGCISTEEISELKSFMQEDEDFPWAEFGEFQNLAALYPSSLKIELPGQKLKDKVARELYRVKDEIFLRSGVEEEKVAEETESEAPREDIDLEAEPGKIDLLKDDTSFKDPGLIDEVVEREGDLETEIDSDLNIIENKAKAIVDEEKLEKRIKDYVQTYYDDEVKSISSGVKRNLIISIILFIITIVAIGIVYVLLSSEIEGRQGNTGKKQDQIENFDDIDKIRPGSYSHHIFS